MDMGRYRTLSPEELGEVVSSLVKVATGQQDVCEELLGELKTALNALDCGITELKRDMPNKIAQQAAEKVVKDIACDGPGCLDRFRGGIS
jgi:hypothetical protein